MSANPGFRCSNSNKQVGAGKRPQHLPLKGALACQLPWSLWSPWLQFLRFPAWPHPSRHNKQHSHSLWRQHQNYGLVLMWWILKKKCVSVFVLYLFYSHLPFMLPWTPNLKGVIYTEKKQVLAYWFRKGRKSASGRKWSCLLCFFKELKIPDWEGEEALEHLVTQIYH